MIDFKTISLLLYLNYFMHFQPDTSLKGGHILCNTNKSIPFSCFEGESTWIILVLFILSVLSFSMFYLFFICHYNVFTNRIRSF